MVEAPQRVPYGKPGPVDRWLRANLANSSISGAQGGWRSSVRSALYAQASKPP
jgi:hypothetical protein